MKGSGRLGVYAMYEKYQNQVRKKSGRTNARKPEVVDNKNHSSAQHKCSFLSNMHIIDYLCSIQFIFAARTCTHLVQNNDMGTIYP